MDIDELLRFCEYNYDENFSDNISDSLDKTYEVSEERNNETSDGNAAYVDRINSDFEIEAWDEVYDNKSNDSDEMFECGSNDSCGSCGSQFTDDIRAFGNWQSTFASSQSRGGKMDTKALAKSKRAHSQHHSKKHHPGQTSKAPSASGGAIGIGSAKKPSGNQIRDKPRQSQGSSALPSNWDRYEEGNSGSEDQSKDSTSQATDVIVPKSKGADYGYLISEAMAQSQINISSMSLSSMDDVLTDFNQGLGSLLSVRGQSILSWTEDDNFIVEDRATASNEASFLSLNLHALAEQLEKVDLSRRLFIEEDLLPPELCTELQASDTRESTQDQATCGAGNKASNKDSGELASRGLSEGDKNVDRYSEVGSSEISSSSSSPVPIFANKGSKSMNQVKDELWQFGGTGQSSVLESIAESTVNSDANPKQQQSRFETAAAEAELDMLLDSFNETKFIDSSGFSEKSSYKAYVSQQETSASLSEGISFQSAPAQPLKKGPDLLKSGLAVTDFDNALDELLNETSNLMSQAGASSSHEVIAAPVDILSPPSSHPVSKSKVLDDFDSWLDTI
ncbi:hypothetical protein F0562_010732 [Nyssa sinensis]|uniref:Uncharacterized protein n=1 Tax=Nyssa sinensis TaxID=561372 RepID=A0A5J5A1Y3_9ASTE|nr:hypothetical protein F0562_010732 [Nyssa sinensis]